MIELAGVDLDNNGDVPCSVANYISSASLLIPSSSCRAATPETSAPTKLLARNPREMSTVYQPVKGLYVARPQMNDTAEGKNM